MNGKILLRFPLSYPVSFFLSNREISHSKKKTLVSIVINAAVFWKPVLFHFRPIRDDCLFLSFFLWGGEREGGGAGRKIFTSIYQCRNSLERERERKCLPVISRYDAMRQRRGGPEAAGAGRDAEADGEKGHFRRWGHSIPGPFTASPDLLPCRIVGFRG